MFIAAARAPNVKCCVLSTVKCLQPVSTVNQLALCAAGDNLFFRAWQFQLPRAILSVPQALVEAMVWSIISYWLIGLAPDAGRWGKCCW